MRFSARPIVGAIVDVPNAAFRDGITLLRLNEVDFKGANAVGLYDSLEGVLEVDVPSNTVASAVNVVGNLSVVADGR